MLSEVLRRFAVLAVALGLSLAPALLGLSVLPQLAEYPRFFNAAWIWFIMVLSPGGFARIEFDGAIWLADSAPWVSLSLWTIVGLAYAVGLRRIRLAYVAVGALPLLIATGLIAHVGLGLFGIAAYVGV